MIRFTLFGIPVEIQPFFWVTAALLGGALDASTPDSLLNVVLFIAAAFVSIMVHELGHALTGMKLGGGRASIALTAFGGLAMNQGARLSRDQRFRMVAAGPGAGLGLFVLVAGVLCLAFYDPDVWELLKSVLFDQRPYFRTEEIWSFLSEHRNLYILVHHFLWINFWWSLLNLLPVMPLDGGHIADLYVTPKRRVFLIGAITAGVVAAYAALKLEQYYMAVFFGYLAWKNHRNMRDFGWQ